MKRAWIQSQWGNSASSSSKAQNHGKGGIQSEDMQFADYLLGSLGRGCRSCVDLQEAAHAMVLESGGSCSSVTRKISKIGACGRHPQNAERDLFRLLSLPCDPYNVKICIKDSLRPKRTTSMDLPIILPHEMLDYLHRSKKIVVNPEQVKQYWTRYKAFKSPSHPCCKDDLLPHSPLGLAGDDCKYTLSGSKVIIIAFNLPLHDQNESRSRWKVT